MSHPQFESSIKSLPLLARGKVRDIYAVDEDKLLIVTSDRLSAFDVILPNPIPRKGEVLTKTALFWFDKLSHILPNQLTGIAPEDVVAANEREQVIGRALVVKRLKPLPVEAVVRGYIIGGGWKDYQATGKVCGITLPVGLKQAAKLEKPLFTPSTKAEAGTHDENIDFEECAKAAAPSVPPKCAMSPFVSTPKRATTPPRAASSSPTPSSSSVSIQREHYTSSTKPSRPIPRASGLPTVMLKACRHRRMTNNSCATIWRRWTGTRPHRDQCCPMRCCGEDQREIHRSIRALDGAEHRRLIDAIE